MTRIACRRVLTAAVVTVLLSRGAVAGIFDMKTKTKDGDAKMELGEYKGLKHAIGCKGFENQAGWQGEWKIGHNLSIMLESALFDTGRFVIVEREKLNDVIAEQDLVTEGRAAKTKKVAKTGVIRPARYLGSGAVTEVEESQSGGGGGIAFKGIRLGAGKSKAQVTIIAKLIDTSTSEIVAKKRIVGKAGRGKLNVGLTSGDLSTDMGGFVKTPLGEAAQDCINQAAVFFAKSMEEIPFEGSVIKATAKGVIINRGEEYGIAAGQMLAMQTEGEELIDPDTGALLGREDGETIGKLKVTSVKEKFSYCEVLEGEEAPRPGTIVAAE